jgi:hypothetical protein
MNKVYKKKATKEFINEHIGFTYQSYLKGIQNFGRTTSKDIYKKYRIMEKLESRSGRG